MAKTHTTTASSAQLWMRCQQCLCQLIALVNQHRTPEPTVAHVLAAKLAEGFSVPQQLRLRVLLDHPDAAPPLPDCDQPTHLPLYCQGERAGWLSYGYPGDDIIPPQPLHPAEIQLAQSCAQLLGQWLTRQSLQDQLQHSERLYHSILRHCGDAFWLIDCHLNRVIDCNALAEHLLSYRLDELWLKPAFSLFGLQDMALDQLHEYRHPLYTAHGQACVLDLRPGFLSLEQEQYIALFGRDVTEALDKARRLGESEARYRSLVESLSEGVVLQDAAGQIITCNRAAEHILGLSLDQLRQSAAMLPCLPAFDTDGQPFPERLHPVLHTLATGEARRNVVMGLSLVDGSRRWISLNVEPIVHAELPGTLQAVVSSFTDISDEIAQRESLRLFRKVAEHIDAGVLIVDMQRNPPAIMFANQAACDICGHSKERLLGSPPLSWFNLAANPEASATLHATLRSHGSCSILLRHDRRDGQANWCELYLNPVLGEQQRVSHYVYLLHDVSQREQARQAQAANEARWTMALEAAGHGVWDWRLREQQVFFSRTWRQMLGYAEQEIHDQLEEWQSRIHPDDLPACQQAMQQHLQGERDSYQHELRMRCKDGSYKWILDRGMVIERDAGQAVRMIGTFTDLSTQKENERTLLDYQDHLEELVSRRTAALEQALQDAQAADIAKDEFLATISHEIRTPMNAILGFSELAHQHAQEPKLRGYIDRTRQSAQHLLELINAVLDFSKLHAGMLQLEELPFSPLQTISQSVELIRPRAQEKGLTLELQLTPPLPATLHGDPLRLRQILLNLLSNAVKFTGQGFVQVQVIATEQDAQHCQLQINVRDSGCGIPDTVQATLFTPFMQADNSITRRYGGTGLGLAISRHLTQLMGGQIRLHSSSPHGSDFELRLPFRQGRPDAAANPAATAPHTAAAWHGGRYRVLLAEDNLFNRELAQALLQEQGLVVDCVDNGPQALDAASQQPYQLILVAINLPMLDGAATTQALRAQGCNTPIIAMSADDHAPEHDACLPPGSNARLTTPLEQQRLLPLLRQYLPDPEHALLTMPDKLVSLATLGFDTATPIQRLQGDHTRYLHFLRLFLDELPAMAERLRATDQRQAPAALQLHTHALKSAATGVGCQPLQVLAQQLEDAIAAGHEAWQSALAALLQALPPLQQALARALADPSPGPALHAATTNLACAAANPGGD